MKGSSSNWNNHEIIAVLRYQGFHQNITVESLDSAYYECLENIFLKTYAPPLYKWWRWKNGGFICWIESVFKKKSPKFKQSRGDETFLSPSSFCWSFSHRWFFWSTNKAHSFQRFFFANQFQQNVFGWILARCFVQMIFVKWATKNPSYLPFYWLVHRDHYHDLL